VVEGPDGLVHGLRRGSAWIDMSTSDVHQMARMAERLRGMGVAVLEATATGGVQNAREGRVTLFVGGRRTDFDVYRPVLEGIANRIFYMGELGRATITKLITNMMCFVHQSALAEGLILGAQAGIDSSALLEAIQASYAGSFVAEVDGPQILDGSYDRTFTIGLVAKDMTLGLALANEFEVPTDVMPRRPDWFSRRAIATAGSWRPHHRARAGGKNRQAPARCLAARLMPMPLRRSAPALTH